MALVKEACSWSLQIWSGAVVFPRQVKGLVGLRPLLEEFSPRQAHGDSFVHLKLALYYGQTVVFQMMRPSLRSRHCWFVHSGMLRFGLHAAFGTELAGTAGTAN